MLITSLETTPLGAQMHSLPQFWACLQHRLSVSHWENHNKWPDRLDTWHKKKQTLPTLVGPNLVRGRLFYKYRTPAQTNNGQ